MHCQCAAGFDFCSTSEFIQIGDRLRNTIIDHHKNADKSYILIEHGAVNQLLYILMLATTFKKVGIAENPPKSVAIQELINPWYETLKELINENPPKSVAIAGKFAFLPEQV